MLPARPRSELDAARVVDHVDRLYRAARALTGSAHEAEDLVQETCARVLARPRRLKGGSELAYLLTALRHTFFDGRRRRRPDVVPIDRLEHELADGSPDASPEAHLAAQDVLAAVAALPERFRLAVAAVDVAGLTYEEAAHALDVPLGTVMSRLYRGRRRLVERLHGQRQAAA